MTIQALLQAMMDKRPAARVQWDLSPKALSRWNPGVRAAIDTDNNIGIFDVIGEDYWGDGVTAKRISGALRSIGKENPVTVNINSPGGDLFEGLTIYSLLREHEGEVTVKVMGMAASAASIISMAADRLEIARSGFLMIHNAWSVSVGNRHDHREFAEYLEPFDSSMADIYVAHTGLAAKTIADMMDRETWIGGQTAIDEGFADALLPSDEITEAHAEGGRIAAHKIDVALAKAGVSRSERRKLFNEFKSSTPSAAGGGMPRAATTDTPRAVELEPLQKIQFHFPE